MVTINVNSAEVNAVLRNIEALEGNFRAAAQNVIQRYAYKIAREAKGLAPLDTGALRASGKVTVARFAATVSFGDESVAYASVVELGRRDQPSYPAQPYLTPAFEQNRTGFIQDLQSAVRQTTPRQPGEAASGAAE